MQQGSKLQETISQQNRIRKSGTDKRKVNNINTCSYFKMNNNKETYCCSSKKTEKEVKNAT